MTSEPWTSKERFTFAGLVLAKLLLHVALIKRYGFHRDELYYIACGRHLAFGYVDHPPLVPWLARLSELLFGHSLIGLRVWPVLAGAATVALSLLLCRELGGRWFALLITGLSVLLAPAFLRMGAMLCIPVFEPLFWLGCSLILLRIARGGSPRLWLLFGLVFGVGLLNKHSMLLFGPGLCLGLLATSLRAHLAKPWLWLGGAVALVIFAPNLVWQATHGWATVAFLRNMNRTVLAQVSRGEFLAGQLLYMHPFQAIVWMVGLVWLFRRKQAGERTLGFVWLGALVVLLFTRGKPYYLAPAYPALFAAGGVALEGWLGTRGRAVLVAWIALGSTLSLTLGLPILPVSRIDRMTRTLFGWAVKPTDLTHDFHDEFGWQGQVRVVTRVVNALSPRQRRHAVILTSNYGEASAVAYFGRDLPPVVSGHMTYFLWGHGPDSPSVVIAYGMPRRSLTPLFARVEQRARIHEPLAMESDLPVFVCSSPRRPWASIWPTLRRYYHGPKIGTPGKLL